MAGREAETPRVAGQGEEEGVPREPGALGWKGGGDEAGQVWNKLGKEEDGCEEGLQGGDVELKAKGGECVWGKGRKAQVWRPQHRRLLWGQAGDPRPRQGGIQGRDY